MSGKKKQTSKSQSKVFKPKEDARPKLIEAKEQSQEKLLIEKEESKAALQESVFQGQQEAIKAREILGDGVVEAAQQVKKFQTLKQQYVEDEEGKIIPLIDPRIAKLQLDACQFNLRVHGVAEPKREDRDRLVVINIASEHIDKVIAAGDY